MTVISPIPLPPLILSRPVTTALKNTATGATKTEKPGNTAILNAPSRAFSSTPSATAAKTSTTPTAEVPTAPTAKTPETSSTEIKEKPQGFFDHLRDILNPLQHLPIISHLYRRASGDQAHPGSRLAGAGLFFGPLGVLVSGLSLVAEKVLAQLIPSQSPPQGTKDTAVAAADAPHIDENPSQSAGAPHIDENPSQSAGVPLTHATPTGVPLTRAAPIAFAGAGPREDQSLIALPRDQSLIALPRDQSLIALPRDQSLIALPRDKRFFPLASYRGRSPPPARAPNLAADIGSSRVRALTRAQGFFPTNPAASHRKAPAAATEIPTSAPPTTAPQPRAEAPSARPPAADIAQQMQSALDKYQHLLHNRAQPFAQSVATPKLRRSF